MLAVVICCFRLSLRATIHVPRGASRLYYVLQTYLKLDVVPDLNILGPYEACKVSLDMVWVVFPRWAINIEGQSLLHGVIGRHFSGTGSYHRGAGIVLATL